MTAYNTNLCAAFGSAVRVTRFSLFVNCYGKVTFKITESELTMAKGFVDIQVNGLLGIDFSGDELTLEDVRRAVLELAKHGTAAFCPTVVEAPDETLKKNLSVFAAAIKDPEIGPHILGIHLEGPFISKTDGPRGAHRIQYLKDPSVEFFKTLQEWSEGNIKLLTLAPELPGAAELIKYAAGQGVTVALGHTNLNSESLNAAIKAGARLSTHLGNGISDQLPRHNNPIWHQLAADELYASFVTDGHHLPPPFIKSALRAKGISRSIVVSDASAVAALPPGDYNSRGRQLVIEESGRLSLKGTPYLAGSSATMLECMNYLASLGLLTEEEMRKVGRDNPLKLLNKSTNDLEDIKGPEVVFEAGQFIVKGRN